jgi:alkylated DNA repair protein alkB family protein 4
LRYTPTAEAERYGKHTAKGGAGSRAHGGVSAGAAAGVVHRTCGVDGHLVVDDFMSENEEEQLLRLVEKEGPPWALHTHNGWHWGKSWGVRNLYGQGAVLPADPRFPFPPWLAQFVERIRTQLPALRAFDPNEVNAIWYSRERGDTLSPHVDNRFTSGDIIVNLSLAGSCTMTYAPMSRNAGQEPMAVLLPRRCMQVQSYAARYNYTHGIRNEDLHEPRRVSLTMRESPLRRPGV